MAKAVKMQHKGRQPKWMENAPRLNLGMHMYWEAFWDLTTCRGQISGAVCPIPWDAIAKYGELYNIEGDQLEDLFHFIKVMDNKFITITMDKIQSKISSK